MGAFGLILLGFLASATLAAAADDPLARARTLYNQRQFDAAITAADQARLVPARADNADLIAARAYLERFRANSSPEDLISARDRLRRLNAQRLGSRERIEFLVGVGETLYLEGTFGASAAVFESILAPGSGAAADARERVLDWWASALDRDAKPRSEIDRSAVYQRIKDRMQLEIGARPDSAAASYWLSAAARGQGDLQAAWEAAEAGWVRAPLVAHGETLRADLDQLMTRAIVPERARVLAQTPETLRQEWEKFKERWTR